MGREIIMFSDIEIETHTFHCYKNPDVDTDNILVSKKISSDEKNYNYFIGYLCDDYKIKPLHVMLPKTSMHVKSYDGETKWMYFLAEDNDFWLKKYNTIWDKFCLVLKKKLIANPSTINLFENQNKILQWWSYWLSW